MGFPCTAGTMDLADIRHFTGRGVPVVALITPETKIGHYVTVRGADRGGVYFHDPTRGSRALTRRGFLDRWHAGKWRQWACAIKRG
jgi:predicted double-glycine peptidase